MKVLFLDIDGVLNGHDRNPDDESCTIRQECVRQLNRIVEATGAKIVLSSAWRYMVLRGEMTCLGFDYMLRTHGARGCRVIGTTREDVTMDADERGQQIAEWMATSWLVERYCVLDDEDYGIKSRHPCVITDGMTGLTEADADAAIEILR